MRDRPSDVTSAALARMLLGAFMVIAGIGHFVAHESFLQQTPTWLPARSWIVWISGVVEIALGVALIGLPRHRRRIGWALAVFFVVVLPGNVHQAAAGNDAFGLNSPAARWGRLLFQPVLIVLALWSSGAWPRRASPRRS